MNPARRFWTGGHWALVLLVVVAGLTVALQFRWLGQLRHEESERRRIALQVAGRHFEERVHQQIANWQQRWSSDPGDGDLPILSLHELEPVPRTREADSSVWRPASAAQLRQALGSPLFEALRGELSAPRGESRVGVSENLSPSVSFWLQPPALIECADHCRAALLRSTALEQLFDRANAAAFADFGSEIAVAVVSQQTDGSGQKVLYPPESILGLLEVTDLELSISRNLPVSGPTDREWRLLVNHRGDSLDAAVARSHTRNAIVGVVVLILLLISLTLVVLNARRMNRLAQRQLFFVAGISHELRTPLAAISAVADNLAEGSVTSPERAHRYGELLQKESRRLGTLIENVLQFSKLGTGGVSAGLDSRPGGQMGDLIDVDDLIQSALQSARGVMGGRRAEAKSEVTGSHVLGDRAALESVLVNLLHNAAKYADGDNPTIQIEATTVKVRPVGRALRVRISNPVAVTPESPERWFEPFYRGANASERGLTGAGIGLAVAHGIAQQHGGGLSVDASVAGRVTLVLYLPLAVPR